MRPPIVVVMGHIDHGKTTLLDWFRKSSVAAGESGGITQHIGAYHVDHNGRSVTFIDTPGHEAFSAIRLRGARAADIAILVVAADEGVKPQTKEAIEIIRQSDLPFIVALNKMDRPEANADRVKQELAREEVLVEGYGGQVPVVEISAKTGEHMDDLLDTILLVAELEELAADPEKPAEGIIIESHVDAKRGNTATILVRDGTLRRDHTIVLGRIIETVRILEDDAGVSADQIGPSHPALIAGLSLIPTVGETLRAFRTKAEAAVYLAGLPAPGAVSATPSERALKDEKQLIARIVLKADAAGSREAITQSLEKVGSEEIGIELLRSAIGDIGEDDVKFAHAAKHAFIAGFRVKTDLAAKQLAQQSGIRIVMADTIYALLDEIKTAVADVLPPIVRRTDLGRVRILKVFKQQGTQQVVGGKVEEGVIKKGAGAEIQRSGASVGKGVILQLQREKTPVSQVSKDTECGIMLDSASTVREGDIIIAFEEETVKRTL